VEAVVFTVIQILLYIYQFFFSFSSLFDPFLFLVPTVLVMSMFLCLLDLFAGMVYIFYYYYTCYLPITSISIPY